MTCTCASGALSYDCSIHGLKQQAAQPNAKRRTPLKQQSDNQAIREAYLAGIRAERIHQRGMSCESCGLIPQQVQLHHTELRSKGQGYSPRKGEGVDAPSKLTLLCVRCHEAQHGNPEWSNA
jgi:hypothetical protein